MKGGRGRSRSACHAEGGNSASESINDFEVRRWKMEPVK